MIHWLTKLVTIKGSMPPVQSIQPSNATKINRHGNTPHMKCKKVNINMSTYNYVTPSILTNNLIYQVNRGWNAKRVHKNNAKWIKMIVQLAMTKFHEYISKGCLVFVNTFLAKCSNMRYFCVFENRLYNYFRRLFGAHVSASSRPK